MKQVETAHMHAMRGYPYMQQFLARSMTEDVSEVLLAIEEKKDLLTDTYDYIWSRIDYSALPENVNGEMLRKMMDFSIKGLMAERLQNDSFQPEMMYEEVTEYLDMMKRIVY